MEKTKICYWKWREKQKLPFKRIPAVICYNNTCDGFDIKCKDYRAVGKGIVRSK